MTATNKTTLKLRHGKLTIAEDRAKCQTATEKSQSPRTLRILSIDGGGIKGIVPATILVYLEERLQEFSGDTDLRIADCFDWVAGSSTGGILACFYLLPDPSRPGRPKLSAKEALERYLQQGQGAFQRTYLQQARNKLGIAREEYSHRMLERQLKRTIGKEVKLSDLVRPCTIPAYNALEKKPIFFNSQAPESFGELKAWQVAKATSSAPGFFRSTYLKDANGQPLLLQDASLWTTDPSLCAYWEARKTICQTEAANYERQTFLLSLGTGKMSRRYLVQELRKQKERGQVAFNQMMARQSCSSQQRLREIFSRYEPNGSYCRLDPALTDATSAMDNVASENLNALYELSLAYVEAEKPRLDKMAKRLVEMYKIG
ncbi:MAG: patatin-like phospholipase family protein [Saprospiraceae bacterium]|nr:patatin-like phospholipase family protein [Saprospiraceae bacterium]